MRMINMIALILLAAGLLDQSALGQQDDRPPPSAERIAGWIRELDADRYVVREAATRHLIESGTPAVSPLVQVLPQGSLEMITRGIHVLRELALSGSDETEIAARAALEHLSRAKVTAAARRAENTLRSLNEIRQERAIAQIKRWGGTVGTRHYQLGFQIIENLSSVEIDENWRGGEKGLSQLKWLTDIQQLTFKGPQVTDAWLKSIQSMDHLSILNIKRAKITDAGLAHLKQLQQLRYVSLLYDPISDDAIEHLSHLKGAEVVRIYGTRMTRDGAQRLAKTLGATTRVDYRRGAFLGISCQANPQGCFITRVQPDSAASRAGLQVGDIIVTYNDRRVADFTNLTELIAENEPGDKAAMKITRGNTTISVEITLGEWD